MSVENNSKNVDLLMRLTVLRLFFSLTESQGVENQENCLLLTFVCMKIV